MLTKDKIEVGKKLYCVVAYPDIAAYHLTTGGEYKVVKMRSGRGRRWADLESCDGRALIVRLDLDTFKNGGMFCSGGLVAYESEEAHFNYETKRRLWNHLTTSMWCMSMPNNITIADMLDFAEAIGVELPTELINEKN